jgi:hypothetical protein
MKKDNLSILLAPNGKPTNLTPEQYKLVRTKAFKDWFGDWENDPENASKVVDSNGEPLVCYHGTTFDFNTFEKTIFGKFGKGMYFTSYIDFAKKYAKNYDESRIIPVFLKSINLVKTEELFLDQIKNIPKNYDGIWSSLVWTNDYDYNEISEDEIIVYSPEQIKIADGTNTTFDGNNPDIRFEDGGEVEDLISKGIVELKMFDTKPEHAKEYGFDVKKPLYVKSICISENERLKGIGKKVLDYIDEYAVKNGHDLIFGHITQKANFTKDSRHTDLCDIDLIKEFLIKGGYSTIKGNNDFYKVIKTNPNIRFDGGGDIKNQEFKFERKNVANEIYSSNKKKYGRFSTLRLAEINTDEILILIISEDEDGKENLVYEKVHKRPANSMFYDNLIKRIKQKTEVEEKLRNAQSYRIYPIYFNDKYTDEKVKKYFELKNLSELYNDYVNEKKIEKEQNKIEKEKEYPIDEKLKRGNYYMIYFSTRGDKSKSKSYLKMRFDNLIISESSYLLSKNPIYYLFSTDATTHKVPFNELNQDFINQNIMTIDDFEEKFGASNSQSNIENYIDGIEKERKNYDNNKDKFTRNRLSKNIQDLLSFVFQEPEYSDFEFTDSQKANVLIYCTKLYKNYFPAESLIGYIISSAKDFEYEYNSKISYWDILKENNLIKPYFVNSVKYKINPENRELKKIFEDITSKDSLRPIMMGVNFVGNQAIGTDAHKLVHVIGTKEGDFEDGVYPLSKKAIDDNGNGLISGIYPNWKAILPNDCTIRKSLSLPFIYSILENLKKNLVLSKTTFYVQFILKDDNNEEFKITFNHEILQDLLNSLLLVGLNHVDACFYSSSRYMLIIPRQEKIGYNEDLHKINFGLIMPFKDAETQEPIKIEIVNEDELNLTIGKTATKKLYKSDVFDYLKKQEKKPEENTKVYYQEIIDTYNTLLEIETDKNKKEYFKEIIDSYKNLLELL